MIVGHPSPHSAGGAGRDGERGAILVLVSICLTVLVTATAFTVDLGRISVVRRDLQNVADAAATDLSRLLDGRTASELVADPAWDTALQASLARNGFGEGNGEGATSSVGHWDATTETFSPSAGSDVPDAVRVEARGRVDFEFAPGGRDASRMGVASRTPAAGFCVGNFAARLDSSRSVLTQGLLGDALDVTAVGYGGLAGGRVGLADLATELGLSVGSPGELLAAEVSMAELVAAEADVLRAHGDLARAAILDQLVVALPDPDRVVALGDLVTIASGGEAAAAAAQLDVLELLWTSAMVANGSHFLDVPDVGIALPGDVVTAAAQVQVIEQPMCAFGPAGTTARTAQVHLRLTLHVDVPAVSQATITIDLQGGAATATSRDIRCGTPTGFGIDLQSALVTSRTDVTARLSAVGVPVADVVLHATTGAAPATRALDIAVPPSVFGEPEQITTPGLDLGGATLETDEVTVLGALPIGVAVDPLVTALSTGIVTPLLGQVDDALVSPLSGVVGLTIAGADITPVSVACTRPRLVG